MPSTPTKTEHSRRATKGEKDAMDAFEWILAMLCDRELCGHFTAEEIRGQAERGLKALREGK